MTTPTAAPRPWRCPRTTDACSSPLHHDTLRGYTAGCRSRSAAAAAALNNRTRTRHCVDATGTARKLQALAAIGWPDREVAARLHLDNSRVGHLRKRLYRRVWNETADAVHEVFVELSETPGPSNSARVRALNRGDLPAEAWDHADINDPDAEPWTHTDTGSIDEPVAELTDLGCTAEDIADRLGTSKRAVERARARNTARHQQQGEVAA